MLFRTVIVPLACALVFMAFASSAGAQPSAGGTPAARAAFDEALAEPVSALGKKVLDVARPSVVQIKAFFEDNAEKSSHGSGFVVAADGVAITNYHVVSDVVMYPDKYRLEFKSVSGKTGSVQVIAIDVLHDVALVRLIGHSAPALTLSPAIPPKGERAYSVGFPLDVGLTITEGVSNGLVDEAFDERLHYAGAVNGGMSGGPALDAQARVIGVNVSAYRFQQSVSFLVPAVHAQNLLQQGLSKPLVMKDARKEVSRQLAVHAGRLLAKLPAALPVQTQRGVALPTKLAAFFDCGASGDPSSEAKVQSQRSNCAAKAGLYVNSNVYSGDISFSHRLFSTTKLDSYRFAKFVENASGSSGFSSYASGGSRKEYGASSCNAKIIDNNGIEMFAEICTRAYRKFDGLFDVTLKVVSSHRPREGFTSNLSLTGMPFEPAMQFVQRYLAAIKPGALK